MHPGGEAPKSKRYELALMKTAYRSRFIKSVLRYQETYSGALEVSHSYVEEEVVQTLHTALFDPASSKLGPSQSSQSLDLDNASGRFDGRHSGKNPLTVLPLPTPNVSQAKKQNAPPEIPAQNVFQARAEISRRRKGQLFRSIKKDKLLSRYFENRRLVSLPGR